MIRCHYYLIPRSQQAYKYLQMAVGMMIDLGLDDDPQLLRKRRPDLYMRGDGFRTSRQGTMDVPLEAERAALGCWYLSSVYVQVRRTAQCQKLNLPTAYLSR